MRHFKNIVASITYYRKHNLILFVFFTISLLLLTCLELLSSIQQIKLEQLTESWSALSIYLSKSMSFSPFEASNDSLQATYATALKVAVIAILLTLIGLTGALLYSRRQDIRSLLSLGLKKSQISLQLMVETLFPIVTSFACVLAFALLFQFSFLNKMVALNDHYFKTALVAEVKRAPIQPTVSETHGPLSISQKSESVILPFNSRSVFASDTPQTRLRFTDIRQTIAKSFLLLASLSLLAVASVTSLTVLVLSYRMNF